MFTKNFINILVLGWLGLLAACSTPSPVDLATPSPSKQLDISATPEKIASPQSAPSPAGFDCSSVQEILFEECQALVTLYKKTNGDSWADHTGWLASQTPCNWYGVICQQGHVAELQLYYNKLAGSLPGEIGNLSQLKSLYLDRDQLRGPIPAEIGNLSQLQVARLGGNQFDSLPAELANLKELIYLDLSDNPLSGEIPAGLGSLPKLQELRLNSDGFNGSIPPELGNLSNLTHLDLSRNQLGGPVPAMLGNLIVLNEVNLSFNQLTGSIPPELSNLKNLYALDLSYNQLTGKVPAALARTPISDLKLWGNQLEGTIPVSKEGATTVDYEGVHFEIDAKLAESIWPEVVPAQLPSAGGPEWEVRPESIRFTITGSKEQALAQSSRVGIAVQPQILIYPAQEYGALSEFAKAKIEGMQAVLKARPSIPEGELPFLPLVNAAQVFHAQNKYIDFQNGSGMRFITEYSQDISPVTNRNLFYTFQGLTEDGSSYLSVYFPITAKGLSDEPEIVDWDAFSAGYQGYLTQTVNDLNALSSDEFEPDLEGLDQVIQSMRVVAH
ncbi:MAG: leucine-rich repeat domain-containing protein [Syntrophothermus sp.]